MNLVGCGSGRVSHCAQRCRVVTSIFPMHSRPFPGDLGEKLRSLHFSLAAEAHRMNFLARRSLVVALCIAMTVSPARAGGPFAIDHIVPPDESGIWNPNVYRGLMLTMTVGEIGLALYEGGETRLGNTA